MCHWHYEVHAGEGLDNIIGSFPFAGGVYPDIQDRERVLEYVRRMTAGYVNIHPEGREGIRIVEMSCNGPQYEIRPYAPGGEQRVSVGRQPWPKEDEDELFIDYGPRPGELPVPPEWDAVREYFATPIDQERKEKAREKLRSCVEDLVGASAGRDFNAQVVVPVPHLYGLLDAFRDFELASGKLFVASLDEWGVPDGRVKTVSSLKEARDVVSEATRAIVYTTDEDEPLWSFDHDHLSDAEYITGLEELLGTVSAYFADVAEVVDLHRWRAQIERSIDELLPEMARREKERGENNG